MREDHTVAPFGQEEYQALLKKLTELSEEGYRSFTQRLIPGAKPILGVRTKALEALAKELARGDWRGYLACARVDTHEEEKLQALVIAGAKCGEEERLALLSAFVPALSDWETCDTLCSRLKCVERNRERYWDFLRGYLASAREFELRFAIICFMHYYRTDDYIDQVLALLAGVRNEAYYVRMGVAWTLSFCFISHRDKTYALLSECVLDPFTQNKTIQKCRESYRISDDDKAALQQFKI